MQPPIFTNRLIKEKSPYLFQHAHNPVDWYPWSEEAFRLASELDKPIFLSIGYAACHWCHVMGKESFENLEIAKLMNDTFVNIQVDREEMPEVDSLYMEFAQAMMSGGAGWPLNVLLTPQLKPFFATTYLPPDTRFGFLGLKQLILRIEELWQDPEERENVILQAGKIVDIFQEQIHVQGEELPHKESIHLASEMIFKSADPIYGGTQGIPKFPVGFQACFLLRVAKGKNDSRALFYVERSLEMMRRGGIWDHLGGGFARYSIDERWMVPHFEKMLYDNAILAEAYLETWVFTHQHRYREVVTEIFNDIQEKMVHKEGGFYSAEDADTEGEEGKYYLWTFQEIHQALGPDASLFCEFFGVSKEGNFEGKNILHTPYSLEEFAHHHHLDPLVLANKLAELKTRLRKVRDERVRPSIDDKVVVSSNALLNHALSQAGLSLREPKYLQMALKNAQFIKEHLWKEGRLLRRWKDGEARFNANLDDYALLIRALISLFEADLGVEWLEFALLLTETLSNEFKASQGAFYLTDGEDPNLLLRRCEFYDGAEPSGNAVHAENLIRLHMITGSDTYLTQAEDILKAAKQHIDLYPQGAVYHLMALMHYLNQDAPTLLIALNQEEQYKEEIEKMIYAKFIPHKVVIWKRDQDEELRDLVPMSRDKATIDQKTTLYLCTKKGCAEPVTELSKMWDLIEKL